MSLNPHSIPFDTSQELSGNNGKSHRLEPEHSEPKPETSDWKDPVLFDENKVTEIEIPSIILPGIYGEFSAALSSAMEVPAAMTVAGILGVVSAAASHRFYVSPKQGWSEPINIYIAAAIEPGNLKSPTQKKITRPIIEWEIEQAAIVGPDIKRANSERKTKEKIIEKLRSKVAGQKDPDVLKADMKQIADMGAELEEPPVLPKVFATDTTPEQLAFNTHEQGGKFAVISDEGGIMKVIAGLYSGGNSNIDIVLKGIDRGAVRIRRKDRSFDLSPSLTFCLFCQPSVIKNMGRESSFDGNGLIERFFYLLPKSRLGHRSHENPPVSDYIQAEYNKKIYSLLNEYMDPSDDEDKRWTLNLSPEAFKEWRDFQDHIETQLRPGGKLYSILGWGGKICGYTLRLAGLLHVMEYGHHTLVISLGTMNRALELAALLIDHALAAFNLMGADESRAKVKVVYEWIVFNGKANFKKRECQRVLHGQFRTVNELEEALHDLEDRNIVSRPIHTPTGGRPGIHYNVNPAIFQEAN